MLSRLVPKPMRYTSIVAVWRYTLCNGGGHINKVTLRRAGLVLKWVTVYGYTVWV